MSLTVLCCAMLGAVQLHDAHDQGQPLDSVLFFFFSDSRFSAWVFLIFLGGIRSIGCLGFSLCMPEPVMEDGSTVLPTSARFGKLTVSSEHESGNGRFECARKGKLQELVVFTQHDAEGTDGQNGNKSW